MGGKGSGPPKYNATVHETIVTALKAGAFKKHAAAAAGVSCEALEDWVRLGLEGDKRYAQFALDVEAAIAFDAIRNQAVITKAAAGPHAGDWKAAAWNLMKKHPRLYGGVQSPEAPARSATPSPTADVEPPVYSPWKDAAH